MLKKMENIYNKVLNLFKGDDEFRLWMNKPFIAGNLAIATNAYLMVMMDKSKPEGVGEIEGYDANSVLSIIPECRTEPLIFSVKSVSDILLKPDKVDEFTECKECEGEGNVEWVYKTYYNYFDCPKCYGQGEVPTGKKVIDPSRRIIIGKSVITFNLIDKILKAADILGSKEISLVHQPKKDGPSLFRIKDVEIICMPVTDEYDSESVVGKIEL